MQAGKVGEIVHLHLHSGAATLLVQLVPSIYLLSIDVCESMISREAYLFWKKQSNKITEWASQLTLMTCVLQTASFLTDIALWFSM